MSSTITNGSSGAGLRGQSSDPLRVEPPARGGRQARVPWIVLGVLIVAGCALAAAVWAGRVAQRTPVVALARAVERGQVLVVEDLTVVNVAVDGQLPLVTAEAGGELVGLSAVSSLPAGTLLTEQMVTTDPGLAAGDRVVGLALDPGEYPVGALAPGDTVMVVRTPPATAAADEVGGTSVLVPLAAVYAVEPLGDTSTGVLVSVVVDEASAAPIAGAAAQDRVRLVLAGSAP